MELTQDSTQIGTLARRERDRLQQLTGGAPAPAQPAAAPTSEKLTVACCGGLLNHEATDIRALEDSLGYHFQRQELIEQALTHSSQAREVEALGATEPSARRGDNEMLEFLGDAVLGLVTTESLFHRFPGFQEGHLSKLRAHLVGQRHLLRVAEQLQIGHYLRLGRGEEKSGGRNKATLLVDALEAILAALYLDGGWVVARDFILRFIVEPELADMNLETSAIPVMDFKSALQEKLQAEGMRQPVYALVKEEGPGTPQDVYGRSAIAGTGSVRLRGARAGSHQEAGRAGSGTADAGISGDVAGMAAGARGKGLVAPAACRLSRGTLPSPVEWLQVRSPPRRRRGAGVTLGFMSWSEKISASDWPATVQSVAGTVVIAVLWSRFSCRLSPSPRSRWKTRS